MLRKFYFKILIFVCAVCFVGAKQGYGQDVDSILHSLMSREEEPASMSNSDTIGSFVPGETFSQQDCRGVCEDDIKKYKKKENRRLSKAQSTFLRDFIDGVFQFFRNYYYIFIIIFVAIIAYYVAGKGFRFRRASRAAKKLNYLDDEGEDVDIKLSDIEALVSKYEGVKEFRVAVRYLYLLLLQKLDARSLIIADDTKKNIDYYYEISDGKMQKGFETALHLYEYIWYGENNIQEQEYQSVSSFYKRLYSTIR
ncbi:MAG: hypothetical protein ACK5MG_06820 [Bacteroidales bacterium]